LVDFDFLSVQAGVIEVSKKTAYTANLQMKTLYTSAQNKKEPV
jgi:hypothetical protein